VRRGARSAPAGCTIISRNFLSYARVLGESWLRNHPRSRFYALVIDDLPGDVGADCGIDIVTPDQVRPPHFDELSFKYDVVELSTAVKPAFLAFLLAREEAVVYLDPDILVLRSFAELRRVLRSAEIVLTPHFLSPLPRDGLRPSEEGMLITGVYNLGFLALARSKEATSLLSWWDSRLRDGSRVDYQNGSFYDQKWMDLVPAYYGPTVIFRDPTYNVAYWNLHERELERRGSTFLVGGAPVTFFHFSGYDPNNPTRLSKRVNAELARTEVVAGTALAELLSLYTDLQHRHGFATYSKWEPGFSRFSNGVKIHKLLRRLYSDLDDVRRAQFRNPFESEGADSFFAWATRGRNSGGLTPFLEALYRTREDLSAAFPDVHGQDREAYLEWSRGQGVAEEGYESELVADPSAS
jgi:hypothetical protein